MSLLPLLFSQSSLDPTNTLLSPRLTQLSQIYPHSQPLLLLASVASPSTPNTPISPHIDLFLQIAASEGYAGHDSFLICSKQRKQSLHEHLFEMGRDDGTSGNARVNALNRIRLVAVEHFTEVRRFLVELVENEALLERGEGGRRGNDDELQLGRSLIMIDHLSSLNSAYGTSLDTSECRPDYHTLGLLETLTQMYATRQPRVDYIIMDIPQMDIVFYRRFFGGLVCKMFRWFGGQQQRGKGRRSVAQSSEEYVIEVLRNNFQTDKYNAQVLFEVKEDRGICVKVIDYRDVEGNVTDDGTETGR